MEVVCIEATRVIFHQWIAAASSGVGKLGTDFYHQRGLESPVLRQGAGLEQIRALYCKFTTRLTLHEAVPAKLMWRRSKA
jgi:hypothetical protein